jgi:hypothetical protein
MEIVRYGPPIQRAIAARKSSPESPMKLAVASASVVGWPMRVR